MRARIWIAAAVLSFAVVSVWYWIVNRPIHTIGSRELVPAEGVPGTKVNVCLDNLVWFRTCPSKEYTMLFDAKGDRFDFPVYPVNAPPGPKIIKHKCREWGEIPRVAPGLAKIKSYIKHSCPVLGSFWPGTVTIITQMPDMDLMVRSQN